MGLGDCSSSPQHLNCICAQEPAGTAQSVSMTLVLKKGHQNQSAIAFAWYVTGGRWEESRVVCRFKPGWCFVLSLSEKGGWVSLIYIRDQSVLSSFPI